MATVGFKGLKVLQKFHDRNHFLQVSSFWNSASSLNHILLLQPSQIAATMFAASTKVTIEYECDYEVICHLSNGVISNGLV